MLTKVDHEGPRVESGPIQFGDDWPGVFFRGDEALAHAHMLEIALQKFPDDGSIDSTITRKIIEGFIANLMACHIENFR